MNDMTRWILFGVAALVVIGLSILRMGMRGGGRTGIYLVVRIIGVIVVLGILAWRFWSNAHH